MLGDSQARRSLLLMHSCRVHCDACACLRSAQPVRCFCCLQDQLTLKLCGTSLHCHAMTHIPFAGEQVSTVKSASSQEVHEGRDAAAGVSAQSEKPPLPPSARQLVGDIRPVAPQRHVSTPEAESSGAVESAQARQRPDSGASLAESSQTVGDSERAGDESASQGQGAWQQSTAADVRRDKGAQAQVCACLLVLISTGHFALLYPLSDLALKHAPSALPVVALLQRKMVIKTQVLSSMRPAFSSCRFSFRACLPRTSRLRSS